MRKTLIISSAISYLSVLVSYGINVYIARTVEIDILTNYFLAVSVMLVVYTSLDFGFEQSGVLFCKKNLEKILSLQLKFLKARVIILVPIILIFLSLNYYFDDSNYYMYWPLLIFPLFYLPVIFESRLEWSNYSLVLLIERTLFLLLILIVINLIMPHEYIFIAYALSTVVAIFIQYRRLSLRQLLDSRDLSQLYSFISWSYPTYLIGIMMMTYGHFSRWFVQEKFGALIFAQMTVSLTFVNLFIVFQKQIDKYIRLKLLNSEDNLKETAIFIRNYLIKYVGIVIFGCVLISFNSDWIVIMIFGERWVGSGDYLSVMIFMVVPVTIFRILDAASQNGGWIKQNLVLAVMFLIIFILTSLLIPNTYSAIHYTISILLIQIIHSLTVAYVAYNKITK